MDMEKGNLMTAKTASARLAALAQSSDKLLAAQALEALGEVQASQCDPAAEATLRQAVALDPERIGALSALASRLVAASRLPELRDLLTTQIALHDTLPVRLLLAAVCTALDKPDDAETQARAALKSAPDNPVANQMLAGLLLARSGYDNAVLSEVPSCLAKAKADYGALATPQEKAGLRTMQAVWLALTSDPAGARQQLIDLSKEEPTSTQVREALSAMTVPKDAPERVQ
jgi:predicted Zn-dependent protease